MCKTGGSGRGIMRSGMENEMAGRMKRFKTWVVGILAFASAHVGTVVLFFFLEMADPMLRQSVIEALGRQPPPPVYDLVVKTLPGHLYWLLLPSVALWWLMRRRGLAARYLVVLAWNVQVFMCVVAVYAYCFYVITLPYIPGLP